MNTFRKRVRYGMQADRSSSELIAGILGKAIRIKRTSTQIKCYKSNDFNKCTRLVMFKSSAVFKIVYNICTYTPVL